MGNIVPIRPTTGMSPMEQLRNFVAWEQENNPDKTHIAAWALFEIERLRAAISAPHNERNESNEMWKCEASYGNVHVAPDYVTNGTDRFLSYSALELCAKLNAMEGKIAYYEAITTGSEHKQVERALSQNGDNYGNQKPGRNKSP